jgi:putative hydrolase of the HAD superfamily
MRFRAVLFDAAETLFTTRGSVGEIYAGIARRYGSQASPENVQAAFAREFRGAGPLSPSDEKRWWKDVVYRVFSEVGMIDNFDEFFEDVYNKFQDSQGWMLFPETLEILRHLKIMGLKLGIISNFDTRIYSVMTSLGIRDFFDAVILSSETGYSKPDREIFAAAVQALGVPASEILLVGDSLYDDVLAGLQAGMAAVLIDRNNRYTSQQVQRISSLTELTSILSNF